MNDRDIDRMLEAAGRPSEPLDARLMERIPNDILRDLAPVRPLPAPWVLAACLVALAALAAVAFAAKVGFYGLHKLAAGEAALIYTALAILIWLAAMANAAAMVPAARRLVRPLPLVAAAVVALAGIFALAFDDYSTANFVRRGFPCLRAGLLDALPAALLAWLVVRRGLVLHTVTAGAAAGALAGLAGVLMLELHCPILEAPHAMVWHVAVIPLSALAGAAVGWLRR